MGGFQQDGPVLGNQYDDDALLRSCLRRLLPAAVLQAIEPDLARFGARVVGDLQAMAVQAEEQPPRLVQYDAWGRRCDRIVLAPGWQALERAAAEEGLVAIGYERRYGEWSRLYQFAKLYLYVPASAIHACPLAMTDGAARLLEVHADAALRGTLLPHLVTRDPAAFWSSGQWMTERSGGSDVGASETVAVRDGARFRLHGDKFFASAITAPVAMTLARIADEAGHTVAGSRGLSLFHVRAWNDDGSPNGLRINRLKDKLGTRALPTAEITLDGIEAWPLGEPGRGVANIATLFNVTRIYNACSAVAYMRRGLALAQDYAHRRHAFGQPLARLPLHLETLAQLQTEFAGCLLLVLHLAVLLGKAETGQASAAEAAVLRLLTPLAKLYTGKVGIAVASEVLESFGGAGYVEDTGIPLLLRQAQVLSIWEGTTNVLALDVLRAIDKEDAFAPFVADIGARLDAVALPALAAEVAQGHAALRALQAHLAHAMQAGEEARQAGARRFAFGLSRSFAAALLLEHAAWAAPSAEGRVLVEIARRWHERPLAELFAADAARLAANRAMALW